MKDQIWFLIFREEGERNRERITIWINTKIKQQQSREFEGKKSLGRARRSEAAGRVGGGWGEYERVYTFLGGETFIFIKE